MFSWHDPAMEQELEEVPRADLRLSIGYALWLERFKKVDLEDCYREAEAVLGHLKLSGVRFVRPVPKMQNYFPKTGAPGREDE